MNYREVAKKLKAQGCYQSRDAKGSHTYWYSPITDKQFPVPLHKGKDIKTSLVRAIQKQAGVRLL
ncbi:type II toxin-antitoxin system HicA family toxin [Priestia aryabhattai]|uniref:type II toxin-antitoxin system HicA family toxin n=1 Tax=Priestia aryabhattai TaxID=412384 RepID=UPI00203A55FE|nr:type II toxin-antitoxin system HicA family toxin [Priestia aryabhattai]MCM3639713.1 type II toxin-antitoxin system HicA family toxin [Priestia aryabhattai]